MAKSFKDLLVWQKSMKLAKVTYVFCQKMPKNEQYGLISQMQRCAISIPSNIAEGSKRGTKKDFRQFVLIAKGSAAELETQLLLVHDIYELDTDLLIAQLTEVQKMLEKLSQSLN